MPGFFYPKYMRYRTLGKTGFEVSEIGFGGWAIGGNAFGDSLGQADDSGSLAALNQAYALGCNFFSVADVYGHGHSETLLGQALRHWQREQVFIVTQGGVDFSAANPKPNFSETHLRRAVEESLKRLKLEVIDGYLLRYPPLELIQHGKVFDVLRRLKQEGKIRFYGVCVHDPQEGIQAIQMGVVDLVQAVYNLFDTRIEKQLIDTCTQTNTGLIVQEPLARGFLSGRFDETTSFEKGDVRAVWPKPLIQKRIQAASRFNSLIPAGYQNLAQMALAYPLANRAVSVVIPDCRTLQETTEAMQTAEHPPLPPETLQAIAQLQGVL